MIVNKEEQKSTTVPTGHTVNDTDNIRLYFLLKRLEKLSFTQFI
jgi:hypothetical protein